MAVLRDLRRPTLPRPRAAHQPGTPILDVSHLSLRYETGAALEDVSFHLHAGERVAVVGPNGAGKSTLFKIIAGVLEPTSGIVNVYGQQPGGHICIAYVPQRNAIDWSFPVRVEDVVMMGRIGQLGLFRWPGGKDRRIVQGALEDVGLGDLAHRQISELSGGQQQRMFIARALAQQAELMLMDEPLAGLDVQSEEVIYDILEALKRRNVTVMMATHDLDQAAVRFDRVMLLNHRMLGFGSPQDVLVPERLMAAYGGHLHLIQHGSEWLALGDTCCDEGEGG